MTSSIIPLDTHSSDLAITRNLVTTLIRAVEKEIVTPSLSNQETTSKAALWGEKENAVSVLVKLTGLLLKLIPLEREIAGRSSAETPDNEGDDQLSHEDSELLRRYVERMGGAIPP